MSRVSNKAGGTRTALDTPLGHFLSLSTMITWLAQSTCPGVRWRTAERGHSVEYRTRQQVHTCRSRRMAVWRNVSCSQV